MFRPFRSPPGPRPDFRPRVGRKPGFRNWLAHYFNFGFQQQYSEMFSMASLATAKRSGKTCYCIWIYGPPRRSIWLGDVTKSQANQIFSFVSQLENATNTGTSDSNSVRQWLSGLGDRFHGRLVAAGLTKPRNSVYIKAFFAEQLARLKCSARTRDIYQRAHNKFFNFSGCGSAIAGRDAGTGP